MKIEKEVKKYVVSEDGTELKNGMVCEFTVEDRSLCGVYQGITKRGALKFQNTVNTNVFYNVMPSSIGKLKVKGSV